VPEPPLRVPLGARLFAWLVLREGGTWARDEDGQWKYHLPDPLPPATWFGPNPWARATPSPPPPSPRGEDPAPNYHDPKHHRALMLAWDHQRVAAAHTRKRKALLEAGGKGATP
jgi:hypothetical protein